MIETKPPQTLTLAQLIGREWQLPEPVQQVSFNASGSALICQMADGGLSLLSVADAEHPDKRVRLELETGRSTIRPREKALPPPVAPDIDATAHNLRPLGEQSFAVATTDGAIWQVTARGQCLPRTQPGAPVTALCDVPENGALCVARGETVTLYDADKLAELAVRGFDTPVTRLVGSPDGALVAARCHDRFVLLNTADLSVHAEIPCDGDVACLSWSDDLRWIVAGCHEKALIVADLERGEADLIEGFPGPVKSVSFSTHAQAMISSGAFRVVGWQCPDLPFGTHIGDPIETGKPGLTLVDFVAANPARGNCAVGYANGLVVLCQIGKRDELMLIEGNGQMVTAMQWSPDGAHLAAGFADGRIAILTFPKIMFK